MDTKFTWSTTQKGEGAILHNSYLYRLRRENQNGSFKYVCTIKSCPSVITLKNEGEGIKKSYAVFLIDI